MTKPDLDGAYALQTPEDSRKLYSDWAESYDESFAKASGYLLPEAVSEAFVAAGGGGPVLDVGAGTGLVGVILHQKGVQRVDGTDISAEMLAEAALKDCYETLFEGDVTQRLDLEDDTYSGVVSAGTFTLGHVGPEAFDELLRVSKPGAVFALTINAEHYDARGFAAKFDALSDRIQGLSLQETAIYDSIRGDSHADDKALIAVFRKA